MIKAKKFDWKEIKKWTQKCSQFLTFFTLQGTDIFVRNVVLVDNIVGININVAKEGDDNFVWID